MMMCALLFMSTLSADPTSHIVDALEDTKSLHIEETFIGNAFSIISTGRAYEASLGFVIPELGSNMGISKYALKDKKKITLFNTSYELVSSKEFVASISPNFALKSVEDGLLFQEFLYAIDEEYFNEGFFIEGNRWIFVRDDFFDDIEAWIIETDTSGKILTISHEYGADVVMSDEMFENSDTSFRYDEFDASPIPKDIFTYVESIMSNDFVYEIEASPINNTYLENVSKAAWYDITLSITEEGEYGTYTSIHDLIAIEHNGEVSFTENSNEFIATDTFLMSMQDDFFLTDDSSAELFEMAIDQISKFERKEKARFERNGEWIFIRDEFFDDGRGFIVKTDEIGKITHIEYSWEIPLVGVEVPIEEVFDESEVDWAFTLVEPLHNNVKLTYLKDVPVILEFNDWAATQMGAWIGTFQDSEWVGMYASTDMESPYYDTIPGRILTEGENNISYRLLRPGNDYENPIARIDLSIMLEIEEFDDSGVIWGFTMVEPKNREIHTLEPIDIPVVIEFNKVAADRVGAWIGIFQDGEYIGPLEGSEITIPSKVLSNGENTFTFALMPPGTEYATPIESVDINVWLGE